MHIYLLTQDINTGYDTYASAVVIAENADKARHIHPNFFYRYNEEGHLIFDYSDGTSERVDGPPWGDGWVGENIEDIEVTLLGIAFEGIVSGVVCASFNAG